MIPCDNIDKPTYLTSGLKWSSNGAAVGHPRLHQVSVVCVVYFVTIHLGRGYNTELDLLLAQTVHQYLCLKKLIEAANVFRAYTKHHPSIKTDPPFTYPLLNFLWLLLVLIIYINYNQFSILVAIKVS